MVEVLTRLPPGGVQGIGVGWWLGDGLCSSFPCFHMHAYKSHTVSICMRIRRRRMLTVERLAQALPLRRLEIHKAPHVHMVAGARLGARLRTACLLL